MDVEYPLVPLGNGRDEYQIEELSLDMLIQLKNMNLGVDLYASAIYNEESREIDELKELQSLVYGYLCEIPHAANLPEPPAWCLTSAMACLKYALTVPEGINAVTKLYGPDIVVLARSAATIIFNKKPQYLDDDFIQLAAYVHKLVLGEIELRDFSFTQYEDGSDVTIVFSIFSFASAKILPTAYFVGLSEDGGEHFSFKVQDTLP